MFFLIFLPNALSACFSVKLPILGLFLQNNLASLVPAETPVTTSDRCYVPHSGPALSRCGAQCKTWAGPNARPRRGAPLSSDFMTSSCSVNRVTIVVERRYAVQH